MLGGHHASTRRSPSFLQQELQLQRKDKLSSRLYQGGTRNDADSGLTCSPWGPLCSRWVAWSFSRLRMLGSAPLLSSSRRISSWWGLAWRPAAMCRAVWPWACERDRVVWHQDDTQRLFEICKTLFSVLLSCSQSPWRWAGESSAGSAPAPRCPPSPRDAEASCYFWFPGKGGGGENAAGLTGSKTKPRVRLREKGGQRWTCKPATSTPSPMHRFSPQRQSHSTKPTCTHFAHSILTLLTEALQPVDWKWKLLQFDIVVTTFFVFSHILSARPLASFNSHRFYFSHYYSLKNHLTWHRKTAQLEPTNVEFLLISTWTNRENDARLSLLPGGRLTWLSSDAPLPRSICTQASLSSALFRSATSSCPLLFNTFTVALWEMAAQCRGVIPEVSRKDEREA